MLLPGKSVKLLSLSMDRRLCEGHPHTFTLRAHATLTVVLQCFTGRRLNSKGNNADATVSGLFGVDEEPPWLSCSYIETSSGGGSPRGRSMPPEPQHDHQRSTSRSSTRSSGRYPPAYSFLGASNCTPILTLCFCSLIVCLRYYREYKSTKQRCFYSPRSLHEGRSSSRDKGAYQSATLQSQPSSGYNSTGQPSPPHTEAAVRISLENVVKLSKHCRHRPCRVCSRRALVSS